MSISPKIRWSLLAGFAALAAAPALADVKAGVDAWSRADYASAVREWQGPADKGDADAQFNLGQAYKLGRGVPRDLAKAEALFAKAAEHGHIQAADNLGLLLFQRGERARAMPFVRAASDRGDPRAQYLLGLAHFNADNVPKDWVRAYALVSLAQQAGLAQAGPALVQMDQYIPLDQRQQSVLLASELAAQAQANRARQVAAADLGNSLPPSAIGPGAAPAAPARATIVRPDAAVAAAGQTASGSSAQTAGADYARPAAPPKAATPTPRVAAAAASAAAAANAARSGAAAPAKPVPPAAASATAPAATGGWRIQLGAFGVAANADALWNRVKARPELAGHGRITVPAGRVTKLQAGGFASEAAARAACGRLSAAGFTCIATRN